MKTKIIYISGAEVFEIRDIRAAFEEVRAALNLDKDTVLFGVPVEKDDAEIMPKSDDIDINVPESEPIETLDAPVVAAEIVETIAEISPAPVAEPEEEIESVVAEEQPIKKRGRPRKEEKVEEITTDEEITEPQKTEESEEKVVPILSVLATKEETIVDEEPEKVEIIPEIADATEEETVAETPDSNIDVFDEDAGLEKLLSAMPPLEEDLLSDQENKDILEENSESSDISVDLTLEKLANEFIENQDKIASETKSNTRSKIGKLRNILPFKQSKHKDTGLGDLFGWAGVAANDEDFSVPGFFTNVASKK